MYVGIRKNILPDHAFTQRKTDVNTYIADTLIENICLMFVYGPFLPLLPKSP